MALLRPLGFGPASGRRSSPAGKFHALHPANDLVAGQPRTQPVFLVAQPIYRAMTGPASTAENSDGSVDHLQFSGSNKDR